MSEELVWSEIGFGKLETYVKLDKLGKGTYATVYKGRSKLTKKLVALKEIRLEHEEGAPCTAIWKVSLLEDLKHANIVTLRYIIHTERTLTLVFEYLFTSSLGGSALFLVEYLEGLFLHQEFSSTAEGARGWAESDLTAL